LLNGTAQKTFWIIAMQKTRNDTITAVEIIVMMVVLYLSLKVERWLAKFLPSEVPLWALDCVLVLLLIFITLIFDRFLYKEWGLWQKKRIVAKGKIVLGGNRDDPE
jgi:hypothetical protein